MMDLAFVIVDCSYMVLLPFSFYFLLIIQVIVLGTGLTECILSGLLSVEGKVSLSSSSFD